MAEYGKKRTEKITIRVSAEERDLIFAAAQLDDRSYSEWARRVLIREAESVAPQEKRRSE